MSRPELILSNQLCFLFYRADRAIMAKYRMLLSELGLTYPQYLAMLFLWERGTTSVGDICEGLRLDTGTVSPLLKRLEKLGLVERRRDPDDERSVTIALSAAGASLEAKAAKVPRALAACVGLEPAEYAAWRERLEGLLERIEAEAPEACGGKG